MAWRWGGELGAGSRVSCVPHPSLYGHRLCPAGQAGCMTAVVMLEIR
jgi:hypothetical protein